MPGKIVTQDAKAVKAHIEFITGKPCKELPAIFALANGGDKASLDIFWLKDESLEDSDNLPDPKVLAAEIVESLGTVLEQFKAFTRNWEKNPRFNSFENPAYNIRLTVAPKRR